MGRRVIAVFLSLVLIAGCVSDDEHNRAIVDLERTWKKHNDITIAKNGKRTYQTSVAVAFKAAQLASRRIGMVAEDLNPKSGFMLLCAPAPTPLSVKEWDFVRQKDTPKTRDAIREEVGIAR